jgi:ATP-dependent Clp protease ATP-binding subunit ClpX
VRRPARCATIVHKAGADAAIAACDWIGILRNSNNRDMTLLDNTITPSFIVKYLDQYVIGQDDAKKTVAVAVYLHFKKIARSRQDATAIVKSNVLLVGPSGTGKTLLCETLSRFLGVPFVTSEATALAQSRYVNDEIEAILQRLVDKAEGSWKEPSMGLSS